MEGSHLPSPFPPQGPGQGSAVAGSGWLHIWATQLWTPYLLVTAPGSAGSLAPAENVRVASFPSRPSIHLGCTHGESCHLSPALGQGQVGGASSQETENTQGAN